MGDEYRRSRPSGGGGGDFDRPHSKRYRSDHHYGDDRRGGRHHHHHRGGGGAGGELLDEDLVLCVTFDQWMRNRSSSMGGESQADLVAQYSEFVKNWVSHRTEEFARRHWKEEWFLEKYDPERVVERMKERSEGVLRRARDLNPAEMVPLVQPAEKDKAVSGLELHLDESSCAYLPHVSPYLPRAALEKALQAEGALSIFLSEVNRSRKRRDLGRRGTVVFRDAQAAKDCLAKGGVTCWITTDPDGVNVESTSPKDDNRSEINVPVISYKSLPSRILPAEANNSERMERDEKQAIACAEVLDKAYKVEGGGIKSVLSAKPEYVSALDAAVQYLRHVHFYCYFSGALCKDYGELIHKAATPFLRSQSAKSASSTSAEPVEEDKTKTEGGESQSRPEETQGENEGERGHTAFGRDHDADPRRFFETVDACALRILSSFAEQHETEIQRYEEALKRRTQLAEEALDSFVSQSIRMKNGHVHCELHDKLFQNEMFFRKHLVNFHGSMIRSAQRKVLLDVFLDIYRSDEDKPLSRLPKFVEDVLRGEFVPPVDVGPRFSSSGSGQGFGRPRRDEAAGALYGNVPESRAPEPAVRRYRDPDAPVEAVVEKPKKLQYRTRVTQPL